MNWELVQRWEDRSRRVANNAARLRQAAASDHASHELADKLDVKAATIHALATELGKELAAQTKQKISSLGTTHTDGDGERMVAQGPTSAPQAGSCKCAHRQPPGMPKPDDVNRRHPSTKLEVVR